MAGVLKPDPNGFINQECCSFCNFGETDILYGDVYKLKKHKINVHYFCLLTAATIEQRGRDNQGILGFLPKDIWKEVDRIKVEECYVCKNMGAAVKCNHNGCKRRFHFVCGVKKGSLHHFFGAFNSFCPFHKPVQKIPKQMWLKASRECIICAQDISKKDGYNYLWPVCCRPSSFLHRRCVQKMANHAGYYFKCPFCNNVDKYIEGMKEWGIYVPEQEASWEREPHAYEDLLERDTECTIKPDCLCPKGRSYHKKNTPWEVESCMLCGCNGVHVRCARTKLSMANDSKLYFSWYCAICRPTYEKINSTSPDSLPPEGEGIAVFSDDNPCNGESAQPSSDVEVNVDVVSESSSSSFELPDNRRRLCSVRNTRRRPSRQTASQSLAEQLGYSMDINDSDKEEESSRSSFVDSKISNLEELSRSSSLGFEKSNSNDRCSMADSPMSKSMLEQEKHVIEESTPESSIRSIRRSVNRHRLATPVRRESPMAVSPLIREPVNQHVPPINQQISQATEASSPNQHSLSCDIIVLSDEDDEPCPTAPPEAPLSERKRKRKPTPSTSPEPKAPRSEVNHEEKTTKILAELGDSLVNSSSLSSQISTANPDPLHHDKPVNRVSQTPIRDAILSSNGESIRDSSCTSILPEIIQLSDDDSDVDNHPTGNEPHSALTDNNDDVTVLSDEDSSSVIEIAPQYDMIVFENIEYEWMTDAAERENSADIIISLDSDDSNTESIVSAGVDRSNIIPNEPVISELDPMGFSEAVDQTSNKNQSISSIDMVYKNDNSSKNPLNFVNANADIGGKPFRSSNSRTNKNLPIFKPSSVVAIASPAPGDKISASREQREFNKKEIKVKSDSSLVKNQVKSNSVQNRNRNCLDKSLTGNTNVKRKDIPGTKDGCAPEPSKPNQNISCSSSEGVITVDSNLEKAHSGGTHNFLGTGKVRGTSFPSDKKNSFRNGAEEVTSGGLLHQLDTRNIRRASVPANSKIVLDDKPKVDCRELPNTSIEGASSYSKRKVALDDNSNKVNVLPKLSDSRNVKRTNLFQEGEIIDCDSDIADSVDVYKLPAAQSMDNSGITDKKIIVGDTGSQIVDTSVSKLDTLPNNNQSDVWTEQLKLVKNNTLSSDDVSSNIQEMSQEQNILFSREKRKLVPGKVNMNNSKKFKNVSKDVLSGEMDIDLEKESVRSISSSVSENKSCPNFKPASIDPCNDKLSSQVSLNLTSKELSKVTPSSSNSTPEPGTSAQASCAQNVGTNCSPVLSTISAKEKNCSFPNTLSLSGEIITHGIDSKISDENHVESLKLIRNVDSEKSSIIKDSVSTCIASIKNPLEIVLDPHSNNELVRNNSEIMPSSGESKSKYSAYQEQKEKNSSSKCIKSQYDSLCVDRKKNKNVYKEIKSVAPINEAAKMSSSITTNYETNIIESNNDNDLKSAISKDKPSAESRSECSGSQGQKENFKILKCLQNRYESIVYRNKIDDSSSTQNIDKQIKSVPVKDVPTGKTIITNDETNKDVSKSDIELQSAISKDLIDAISTDTIKKVVNPDKKNQSAVLDPIKNPVKLGTLYRYFTKTSPSDTEKSMTCDVSKCSLDNSAATFGETLDKQGFNVIYNEERSKVLLLKKPTSKDSGIILSDLSIESNEYSQKSSTTESLSQSDGNEDINCFKENQVLNINQIPESSSLTKNKDDDSERSVNAIEASSEGTSFNSSDKQNKEKPSYIFTSKNTPSNAHLVSNSKVDDKNHRRFEKTNENSLDLQNLDSPCTSTVVKQGVTEAEKTKTSTNIGRKENCSDEKSSIDSVVESDIDKRAISEESNAGNIRDKQSSIRQMYTNSGYNTLSGGIKQYNINAVHMAKEISYIDGPIKIHGLESKEGGPCHSFKSSLIAPNS